MWCSIVSQPSARELPGTTLRAVNRPDELRGERRGQSAYRRARPSARRARKHPRRELSRTARRVRRRRRAPRRSCRAPRRRARVPAGRLPATPSSAPHRGGVPSGSPYVSRRSHARRDGLELIRERRAASIFGEKSQQDEPEVAVDRSRARRVLERRRADLVFELPAAERWRIEQPGRQARRVLQQVGHRHVAADRRRSTPGNTTTRARRASPRRQPTSCIKTRRRRDRFGQRGEIERRVEDEQASRRRRTTACRARPARCGPALLADVHGGGRKDARANRVVENPARRIRSRERILDSREPLNLNLNREP